MGWSSKKNGELLKLLLEAGFEALLTVDKNLSFQQNFANYPIPVFVLNSKDSRIESLRLLLPALMDAFAKATPGVVIISV